MEFGAREMMMVLGALVLLAILLDVIRRIRQSRYETIRMPRRKAQQDLLDDDGQDDFGSELPNGGGRVVGYRDNTDLEQFSAEVRQRAEANKPKLSILDGKQQGDQQQEPVRKEPTLTPSPSRQTVAGADDSAQRDGQQDANIPRQVEASKGARDSRSEQQLENTAPEVPSPDEFELTLTEPEVKKSRGSNSGLSNGNTQNNRNNQNSQNKTRSEKVAAAASVIIVHVMASGDEEFKGEPLLESLLNQGLRYGTMKIFHRHAEADGAGEVLFSVANSINPGTFDLNTMADFLTPGISLFFAMEDVEDPSGAVSLMLDTAKALADELGGVVKDDSRSVMTRQTEEHYKQKVAEFCRTQLSLTTTR